MLLIIIEIVYKFLSQKEETINRLINLNQFTNLYLVRSSDTEFNRNLWLS